jgi:hypothetical protein
MDIFQDNLIKAFALDKLPEAEREAALDKVGQAVFQSVFLRALQEMSEEQKDKLDEALEKNPSDPDAMFNFLETTVPNLQNIISEEIESFRTGATEIASIIG